MATSPNTPMPAILTAIGRAKLASATPEQQLRISHIAVGDGGGAYTPINDGMSALVREVWRGTVSNPQRDPGNASVLMFEGVIPSDVGGFFIREMAIFDTDGDMIGIGQITLIEKMGLATGVSPISLTVRFRLLLSNTSDITLIYQDAPALSHAGLSERNNPDAHPAYAIAYQPLDGGEKISVQEMLERTEGMNAVTLEGPALINKGASNEYEITNYDSFSDYIVIPLEGTATRVGSTITLTVPLESESTSVDLLVSRNRVQERFTIALSDSFVRAPSITSPTEGEGGVPQAPHFSLTPFSTVPSGSDTHRARQVQVATDAAFSNIVFDSGQEEEDKESMSVPPGILLPGATYYARAQDFGEELGGSGWGSTRVFTVANQYVLAPTVTVQGAPNSVPARPTLTTSAFSVYGGSDVHAATTWTVRRVSDSAIVWQSLGNPINKTSIQLPAGVLQVSTNYTFSAQHEGATLGASPAGATIAKTAAVFFDFVPANVGKPFGGGYYAGNIQQDDGVYALIVAPKSAETLMVFAGSVSTSYNASARDGLANTVFMHVNSSGFGAALYCRQYLGGGYSDWYLPAKNELEILYRAFKPYTNANSTSHGYNPDSVPPQPAYTSTNPAQTAVTAFKDGGAEAFIYPPEYLSSSFTASSKVAVLGFSSGYVLDGPLTSSGYVRPVRRIKISA